MTPDVLTYCQQWHSSCEQQSSLVPVPHSASSRASREHWLHSLVPPHTRNKLRRSWLLLHYDQPPVAPRMCTDEPDQYLSHPGSCTWSVRWCCLVNGKVNQFNAWMRFDFIYDKNSFKLNYFEIALFSMLWLFCKINKFLFVKNLPCPQSSLVW